MTIYKPKVVDEKSKSAIKQPTNNYVDDLNDDNPFLQDEDTVHILNQSPSQLHTRRVGVLKCLVALTVSLIVTLTVLGTVYFYMRSSNDVTKPWIETCRVHYHEWKTGADGKERSFLLEGELFQQVEIDVNGERYEKLNVPSIFNTMRSSTLHDMDQGLTAVIDLDHARCFITQINSTLVKPIPDFYDLVKFNKAGYYLPDAEVIYDNYQLQYPAIEDVSQFGPRIFSACQYFDTYRMTRAEPSAESEKPTKTPCVYEGERYCMGNAGSKYMLLFVISACVE
jgi:hypothetical protein